MNDPFNSFIHVKSIPALGYNITLILDYMLNIAPRFKELKYIVYTRSLSYEILLNTFPEGHIFMMNIFFSSKCIGGILYWALKLKFMREKLPFSN